MKKVFLSVISAALLLTSLPTAFAINDTDNGIMTAATESDPTISNIIFCGIGYCSGEGVRVRTGPGTCYRIIGHFYKGDSLSLKSVRVTPTPTNSDWRSWLYVTGKSSDGDYNRGFISEQYYVGEEPANIDIVEPA